MFTVFTSTRYAIFALSIACNAIISSVAVWNLGFVQTLNLNYPLDNYLTFLGAFGLAVIFAIISVELIRDQSITGTVWFECVWLGVLFIMNLVGASIFSANRPPLCTVNARVLVGSAACTSNSVLLAFIWLLSVILFWYLALLVLYSLIRQVKDPNIWRTNIKDLNNPECFRVIAQSRPTSPAFQIRQSAPSIIAPKPRRPIPPVDMMTGLQSSYQVEPYQPNQSYTQPMMSVSAASRLYSQHVQNAISVPPIARTRVSVNQAALSPSPPPLGQWPRADIISHPIRKGKARKRPPSPVDVPQNVVPERSSFDIPDASLPLSPNRPRPSGPRTRTGSRSRPPPLDLSPVPPSKGKRALRNWDS